MLVKLDMSKDFDRVEWGFVRGVMERLGFDGKWISLIMQCISSIPTLTSLMVKHMVVSPPLGALDRVTPFLQASSFYMLKAYQLSSTRLPVSKLSMVYPFVGAAQTSPTYSL